VDDIDQDLRLDGFALERMFDDGLHGSGRAPGDGDTAGIGNRDRAVPSNDLIGDRRAFRASAEPVGDERRRKEAARARFPNCHRDRVANANARFDRRPIVTKVGEKAGRPAMPQCFDDRGINIDEFVAWRGPRASFLGNVARARPGP
jgi:hypothetical protein